ncbi:MAG: hypothetical protein H0T73_11345 [Ardenticatenales bacterium]|nr:hypothetical protein [Ardenticatenales bacterium]
MKHGESFSQNLQNLTFYEWVDFVFSPAKDKSWSWMEWEWEFDDPKPPLFLYAILNRWLRFTTQLFRKPLFLSSYTDAEIEADFGFLLGFDGLLHWLGHHNLSLALRKACILSMVGLFQNHLSSLPENSAIVYMWWDLLIFGQKLEDEIKDVMFETLSQILVMPSANCQWSALHGLEHLEYPGSSILLEEFLQQHICVTENVARYAQHLRPKLL